MTDARVPGRGDYFRGQAASALLGAGLMLYFGFVRMLEPSGAELFDRAAWVFFHTLRIGGVAMLLVAAALMTCHYMALFFDAVIAGPIGLLLIGTGLAMAVGGGDILQVVINLVCGYGFITSAAHNYRAAAAVHPPLPRGDRGGSFPAVSKSTPSMATEEVANNSSPAGARPELRSDNPSVLLPPLRTSNLELRPSSEAPPSGYLAALADKKRKDREDRSA